MKDLEWIWRGAVALCAVWVLAVLLAPAAAGADALADPWRAASGVIYAAASVVCHQRPERSFMLAGASLPVCARCTGLYVGALVAGGLLLARGRPGRAAPVADGTDARRGRAALGLGLLPNLLTLVAEWSTGSAPSNVLRASAGAALGLAVMYVLRVATRPVRQSG